MSHVQPKQRRGNCHDPVVEGLVDAHGDGVNKCLAVDVCGFADAVDQRVELASAPRFGVVKSITRPRPFARHDTQPRAQP